MTTTGALPPADRFRIGDIWRSPRGKDWEVWSIDPARGALLRAVHNSSTTQRRPVTATGRDMLSAWERISWGGQP